MPQRNVATNFTFEQQRAEINLLAQDFWSQKTTVDGAASTYLKHDGSNAFSGGTLAVPNAFTINSNSGNGTVTISGNLNVSGTTTTVSSANLEVTDKNILIAKGSTSDANSDGAGITIDSATDITFNFVDAKDALVSSIGLEATTTLAAGGLATLQGARFAGTQTPTAGVGIEITQPDANTGNIQAYDRTNSAYKDLRLKGASVAMYGGSTNALIGGFHSTGLIMESGKTITGVLATAAQTNITSLGTLTGLDLGDNNITNVGEISLDKIKPDNAQVMINMGTDKNISFSGSIGEIGDVTGFQATNDAQSSNTAFGIRANDIRFATGNDERVRITDTGVGIGTNNPGQLLEINGASNPCVLVKDTTNNVISYLYADDTNAYVGSASNHPVIIQQNNGAALTIDTSKNATFAGTVTATSFSGDGSNLTGIAGGGGATLADAGNHNSNRTVLFSANASGSNQTLSTDGGLLYNAAEDALKVNGTIITSGGITGAGGSCIIAAANHSSTCKITVGQDVQVIGKFIQGATGTNSNTIFHTEGSASTGAEFIGNNTQEGFYLALRNKNTNNDAWTTIQSWDASGAIVSSIRFVQVNDANNQGAIAFRTRDGSGGEQERLRIGSAGQLGLSGTNYGSSGQVLTSQGGSAAPQWASAGGGGTEAYFFMGGAGQGLSSATWTRVACNTAYQDSVGGCDVSNNNGRYTVQSGHAGRYYFIGQCSTFANGNNITRADVKIYKNGSVFAGAYQHVISGGSGHARHVGPQIATMDNAVVGDYYELWVNVTGTTVSLSMDGETSKSNYLMGWKIAD